jgi:hypothetical protein
MVKKMISAIRQGIEDEEQGIKPLSLREKRSIIDMLVNEIIVEFQDEEVVLTYIGIIDELMKKQVADSIASEDIKHCDLGLQHQEV